MIEKLYKSTIEYANIHSKDPNTRVGCVIFNNDFEILSRGINEFPINLLNTPQRWERPSKYNYVIHAEINAISNCLKNNIDITNCNILTTLFPCHECLKFIVQCGFNKIYSPNPIFKDKWKKSYEISNEIINELDIEIIYLN